MLDQFPNSNLQTTLMELHLEEENNFEAVSVGETLLSLNKSNYAISKILSKACLQNNQAREAEIILSEKRNRPSDPSVWYQLAEAQGLAGNILAYIDQELNILCLQEDMIPIFQLREALKLSKNFFEIRESIVSRLEAYLKQKSS